jgi:isochorismate pyruvate lyase
VPGSAGWSVHLPTTGLDVENFSKRGESKRMKVPDDCASIEEIRYEIDVIDRELITALGRRFDYVKAIVKFKANREEVLAPERYNAVLQQRRVWAAEAGLDPDVIEQMYRNLIAYFIDEEMKVLNQNGSQKP